MVPRRFRDVQPLIAILIATLWLSAAATTRPDLEPVPAPSLAGMEPAVATQLADAWAAVLELAGDPETPTPELAAAYGELGQLYLAYDLVEPAAACFSNARALDADDFRWPYLAGALHHNERRLEPARASLTTALALRPDDPAALLRLGAVLLELDRPADAGETFERALALPGAEPAARAGLGKTAAARGDHADAVRHFEAALAADPEASALRYPLAIAFRELGRIDDARAQLEMRGTQEPGFPDPLIQGLLGRTTGAGVHLMLGNRALRRDDVDAAVEHFRRAVDANPRSAPAHQALGGALSLAGDADGAITSYSAALAIEPRNPPLHYNLGTLLAERGDDAQAIRHFRAALAHAPDYPEARHNLATALARSGRFADAEVQYRALLDATPDDRAARYYLAQTLIRLDRPQEAETLFQALVDEDPARPHARLALAELLARRHEYRAAAEHYRALLETRDAELDAEPVRFGLAMALLLDGRDREARAALEQAVDALPQSTALRHALARLLAASEDPEVRDGARALTLATALLRDDPHPRYVETEAMALAELGRFDEAIARQERLLAQAKSAGATGLVPALEARLDRYRRGEPARAPWRERESSF